MTTTIDIESIDTTLEVQNHFLRGIVVTIWVGNMEPHSASLDENEAMEFARCLIAPAYDDSREFIPTGRSVMAIRNSGGNAWVIVKDAQMFLTKQQVFKFAAALINAAATTI
jgi:hypothetical protein